MEITGSEHILSRARQRSSEIFVGKYYFAAVSLFIGKKMKDLRLFFSSVLSMPEVFLLPQLFVVVDQKSPRSGSGWQTCRLDVEDL